jgi:hypothetical protein
VPRYLILPVGRPAYVTHNDVLCLGGKNWVCVACD